MCHFESSKTVASIPSFRGCSFGDACVALVSSNDQAFWVKLSPNFVLVRLLLKWVEWTEILRQCRRTWISCPHSAPKIAVQSLDVTTFTEKIMQIKRIARKSVVVQYTRYSGLWFRKLPLFGEPDLFLEVRGNFLYFVNQIYFPYSINCIGVFVYKPAG